MTNIHEETVERVDCYRDLARCLARGDKAVRAPQGWLAPDPWKAVDLLVMEHPELMFVQGLGEIAAMPDGTCEFRLRFALEPERLPERLREMDAAVAELVSQASGEPCEVRASLARDWLLARADVAEWPVQGTDCAWGPVLYGLGTPRGLAMAYVYLCGCLSLGCAVAFGEGESEYDLVRRCSDPWVDVYRVADDDGRVKLGCVDIVGDARDKRDGKPVGPAIRPDGAMREKYGALHQVVQDFRAAAEGGAW